MKELFKKYGARLSEAEREQIWRNVATAPRPSRRRAPRLAPAFATSVVGAAGVLLVVFTLWHGGSPERPVAGRDRPAIADIGTEITEPKKITPAQIREEITISAAVDDVFAEAAEDVAAEPAAPGGHATVASPEKARRSTAATDQAPAAKQAPGHLDSELTVARDAPAAKVEMSEMSAAGTQDKRAATRDQTPEAVVPAPATRMATAPPAEAKTPAVARRADSLRSTISAKIRAAETGEVLPFAEVLVSGLPDSLSNIWNGSFRLEDLEPGRSYGFEVFHLGYAPAETTVTLATGEAIELDIQLRSVIGQTLAALDREGASTLANLSETTSAPKIDSDKLSQHAFELFPNAYSPEAGVVKRAGEQQANGDRSGDASLQNSELPQDAASVEVRSQDQREWGAVKSLSRGSGGQKRQVTEVDDRSDGPQPPGSWRRPYPQPWIWVPPNDQAFDTMFFQHYGTNPFIIADEDNLSTFALDVDNASYTVTRRYLRESHLPPRDAVRVEEFVNYFSQDYESVGKDDFRIYADGAPSPFGEGYHLLRIGIKARDVRPSRRVPANLVFVIDVSGSMRRQNRLGLVKRALSVLLDELDEGDRVGIVVYGSEGRVVLQPTGVERRGRIESAIDALTPGGSTNAEEGLYLAYRMARRNFEEGAIHRLILCSDGVANQGRTGAEEMLAHVRRQSDDGIQLSTIGFGMGNYNDVLMEKLADQGDGNYYYVDELREAKRVFRENLTGTLQTVGKDVKVQVEFNPQRIVRYRLLGYENRDVADRDFRNDSVDAGEVGAGHQVTALYEVKLARGIVRELRHDPDPSRRQQRLATVRLRYEVPDHAPRGAGRVEEISLPIRSQDLSRSFRQAPPRLQLAAVVAEFAEILRGSYWARESQLESLVPMAARLHERLSEDESVREFAWLVRRAASLKDEKYPREDWEDWQE